MKPVIKYLLNGEYHYATVKDIGDIEQLKTSVRTDLVGAINSLIGQTGGGSIPEDLQERLDKFESDLNDIGSSGFNEKELEELQAKITELQTSVGLEIQNRIDELEGKYNDRMDSVTSEYDKKVSDINSDLEDVKTNLNSTKENLTKIGEDLSSVELNVTNVSKSVDEINGELESKIDSTTFDLLETRVSENSTSINQNKTDIEAKASKKELDLATGRISDAEANIKLNSEGITSAVKRDELRKELDNVNIYGSNLLRNTRDWQDWVANTPSRAYIISDTYNHLHIQEQLGSGNYLEKTLDGLEVGKTYTASIWAKSSSNKAKAIFKIDSTQNEMSNQNSDVFLSDSWERVSVKFVATEVSSQVSFTVTGVDNTVVTQFAGAKVEDGVEVTGWQANEDDTYERVINAESTIKQQADQITSMVEKQEEIGKDVVSQKTEINQMAEEIGLNASRIQEIDDEVSEQKASIKVNANNIKSKVEQTDIDKSIEDLSLDSRNLILNSDFFLEMENWSNVNENFKINKIDGKNHLAISRTGLSSNMVASASSNMFSTKSGDKLSIGLDVTVSNLSKLDVKTIVVLDLFDINDTRVNYKEFNINELDGELTDGKTGRLTTRYVVDREDVAKARLRLTLYRNGSISFTNITIEKGDIKSVGWNPAPEDSQLIQAKMQTSIDQNAKDITLKAESSTVDKMSGRLDTAEADLKIASDKIESNVNRLTNVDGTLREHDSQIQQNADEIKSKVTSTEVDEILGTKKYATQSELNQKANEIAANVTSVSDSVTDITLNDKTDILSGTEIYTDKADDDSVVHVEVDGKSVLQAPVGEGRNLLPNTSSDWRTVTFSGWDRYFEQIPNIKEGETFTGTIYLKPSNERTRVMLEFKGDTGGYILQRTSDTIIEPNKEGYASVTATAPKNATMVRISIRHMAGTTPENTVQFKEVKVEQGSTATPYTPAPEDVENNIQSVNNFDIISQKATVNGESAVDGIEVGGRNYALDTSSQYKNETVSMWQKPITERVYFKDVGLEIGDFVTLRMYIKVPKSEKYGICARINFYREDGTYTNKSGDYILPGSEGYSSVTFQIPTGTYVSVTGGADRQNAGNDDRGNFQYKNLKLEKGTKATDWTPAPEDNPYDTLENNLYKTNILLSEPLRSVGDVKDRLFRDSDGLWKVERNVGERVLDGSENWNVENKMTGIDAVQTYISNSNMQKETSSKVGLTSHFPMLSQAETTASTESSKGVEGINVVNNYSVIRVRLDTQKRFGKTAADVSKEDIKSMFSKEPVTVYYPFESPTIETLSDELQNKLNNIASFSKGNYVYTLQPDKSEILANELVPTLHARFKSKGWYRNFNINVDSKDNTQQTINQLKSNKARVDAQYKEVYDNYQLESSLKTSINNAKTAYNTKYNLLITHLEVLVKIPNGSKPTNAQRKNVDTAFSEYTNALQMFEAKYQEALGSVEKRLSNAELKITDEAITSTVTSSTTFKDVKNTANTAKSTADSAKSTAASAQSTANTANSTANTLKNTTLPQLTQRINSAEQKITDSAIVSTVTKSSTYKNDLTGKVSTNEIISRINQTAETVTIDAKRINLNGAVTISSFGTGLKNDFEKAKTDASNANTKAASAQSTANTAKSTADSANTKATTATNTANTAKSTATSAQSTANTAKTTADGAKSTANTAKSTADSANTKATNAQSTANTAKTNATNAINRVAKVETNINNAVTTIDGTGVTVKDGSFFLEDNQSDTKYSVVSKSNLLKDHSFELVDIQYSGNIPKFDTYGNQYFKANQDPILLWKTTGSPRLNSGIGSNITHQGLFGLNTAIVNSTNYVSQAGVISKYGKHTISGFFAPATGMSSTATPRIEVSVIEPTSETSFKVVRTWSKNFSAVTASKGVVRYSFTVDVPSGDLSPNGWAYLQASFKTTNGSWVYVDGCQMVEGDYPVYYDPETGLFDLMNGIKGSHAKDIRINGNRSGNYSAVFFASFDTW